jgi:predicted signal transduction protein with EAL and GGDEF domain
MVAAGEPLADTLAALADGVQALLPACTVTVDRHPAQRTDDPSVDPTWTRELRHGATDVRLGTLIVRPRAGARDLPAVEPGTLLDLAADLACVAISQAAPDTGEESPVDAEDRATTDPLTGLPDAGAFADRLAALSASDATAAGVIVVDVRPARPSAVAVATAATPEIGDGALTAKVARHLAHVVDGRGTLARLSGLTFAILAPLDGGDDDPAVVDDLARAVVRSFAVPVAVADGIEYLQARAGLAIGAAGAALLADALTAVEHAAHEGAAARVVRHRPELACERLTQARAAASLRDAVGAGDLQLATHPVHALADDRVRTVRVTARWDHPELGPTGPDGYAALAQQCGLVVPIWAMTLRAACGLLARGELVPDAHAAVHSPTATVELPTTVVEDPGCVAEVRASLAQWRVDPGRLVLELADAASLVEAPASVATVAELHDLGVGIAARGFGGRRAPTAVVRALPVAFVTLDPAITADVLSDPSARSVLAALVQLADATRVTTEATHVTLAAEADALARLGVSAASGPRWDPS